MNTIAQALFAAKAAPTVGAAPAVAVSSIVNPTDVLNSIILDPKARASINYAKARIAIEAAYHNRSARRSAKLAVVEHLGGQLVHPKAIPPKRTPLPNFVLFSDSSKARF